MSVVSPGTTSLGRAAAGVAAIPYTYINHHAGTPNRTKTKDTRSLDYSSICYIRSRNLQVMDVEMITEKCPMTIPTVHTYK